MIAIKLHPEVAKFFKERGTIVRNGEGYYVYYPFWLKVTENHEEVSFDKLPEDLKEMIQEHRNKPKATIHKRIDTREQEHDQLEDKHIALASKVTIIDAHQNAHAENIANVIINKLYAISPPERPIIKHK